MYSSNQIQHRFQEELADRLGIPVEDIPRDSQFLIGRFAWELAQLYQKLSLSKDRMHQSLVQRLLPEVHTRAVPAHAIATANPNTGAVILSPDQYLFTMASSGRAGDPSVPLYFSQLQTTKLVGGELKYLIHPRGVHKLVGTGVEQPIGRFAPTYQPHPGVWWLGLSIKEKIPLGQGLRLYLDGPESDSKLLNELIPLCTWHLQDKALTSVPGLDTTDQRTAEQNSFLDHEFLHLYALEQKIIQYYGPRFITIGQNTEIPVQSSLSQELMHRLEGVEEWIEELDSLLWFKVVFPAGLDPELLDQIRFRLNCFPIVNRKLDKSRDFTPSSNAEVCALYPRRTSRGETTGGDEFLGIQRIFSGEDTFRPVVLESFTQSPFGHYALQKADVEANDKRDFLNRVAELMDLIQTDLREMDAKELIPLLRQIQDKSRQIRPRESGYYLHLKVRDTSRLLCVRFWSTQGAAANACGEPGDILLSDPPAPLIDNCLRLITTPQGGNHPLSPAEMNARAKELLAALNYH